MFGLIGHLTSLEHAQSVADDLGYPEYANQGLDFWCAAPRKLSMIFMSPASRGKPSEGNISNPVFYQRCCRIVG